MATLADYRVIEDSLAFARVDGKPCLIIPTASCVWYDPETKTTVKAALDALITRVGNLETKVRNLTWNTDS